MSAVVLGHTPFAVAALLFAPVPSLESLPYILAGAVLVLGYQLFLLDTYRIGDLTQVYPLARGSAPLMVAGVSVMMMGLHLSWIELAAVIIIGIGIMSLALVRRATNFAMAGPHYWPSSPESSLPIRSWTGWGHARQALRSVSTAGCQ